MKKVSKIIILVVLMTTSINIVKAKDTILTCEYYKPYNELNTSQQAAILCEIYDNYSHQCYVELGSNKATTSSNKEKIENWGSAIGLGWKAKDFVKANNKCPDYLLMKIDHGYELHAAESMEQLLEIQGKLSGQRYPATISTIVNSDENKTKAIEEIQQYINSLNNFKNNYSIDNCKNNEDVTTRYSECKDQVTSINHAIYDFNVKIQDFINKGNVTENDEIVKEYRNTVANLEEFIKNAEQELEEGNKEVQAELGLTDKDTTDYGEQKIDERASFSTFCQDTKKQMQFIGYLLMAVKIVVPILLIVFGSIDFGKATLASDQDAIQKAAKALLLRTIAGVVIFLLPTVINFVFDGIIKSNTGYDNCRRCIFNPNKC